MLFICPDVETTDGFVKLIKHYLADAPIQESTLISSMAPGELSAIFSSLQPNHILISQCKGLTFDEASKNLIKQALSGFCMDIVIGKGPGARSVRLDLPKFTFVSCVNQVTRTTAELLPLFDYVIRVDDVNLPKICVTTIKEKSPYPITDEACDLIAYRSHYDVKATTKCLSRVIEYTQYSNQTTITKDLVEDAIELSGLGIVLDDYEETEDETLQLFREMNDSLRELKDDMNFIRNKMEDFLTANGIL